MARQGFALVGQFREAQINARGSGPVITTYGPRNSCLLHLCADHNFVNVPTPARRGRCPERAVDRWKRLEMDAGEAAGLVRPVGAGEHSRRDAYDLEGKLLPVHQWPESLQLAVKGIRRLRAPRHRDHRFHAIVITCSTPS